MTLKRRPAAARHRLLSFVWAGIAVLAAVAILAAYRYGGTGGGLRGLVAIAAAPILADPRSALSSTGETWLNAPPLRPEELQGKVILVNFWTYSCINSLRPLPYIRAWADRYRNRGLVVIGVHTPEFGFEKNIGNVRRAVSELGIDYPVVLDSDYRIWGVFDNSAWPAFYFIGSDGRIRRQILGEGGYDKSERLIQTLLAEGRHAPVTDPITPIASVGAQAAADWTNLQSGETYVGYEKARGFAPKGSLRPNSLHVYHPPAQLERNAWSLAGPWTIGPEFATLSGASGSMVFRFHARDLNLVMAPQASGHAARFRVRLDGAEPGADHGADADAQGWGRLDSPRMYQLIRQSRQIADRTFDIEFFDSGASAYVFTFG